MSVEQSPMQEQSRTQSNERSGRPSTPSQERSRSSKTPVPDELKNRFEQLKKKGQRQPQDGGESARSGSAPIPPTLTLTSATNIEALLAVAESGKWEALVQQGANVASTVDTSAPAPAAASVPTGQEAYWGTADDSGTMSVAEVVSTFHGQGAADAATAVPADPTSSMTASPNIAAAATQAPPPMKSISELIERRVRRMLMDDQASAGTEGGQMMFTLDDGPLAGTELWLERNADGWKLDARAADSEVESELEQSVEALQERFVEAGLGNLDVRLDTRKR